MIIQHSSPAFCNQGDATSKANCVVHTWLDSNSLALKGRNIITQGFAMCYDISPFQGLDDFTISVKYLKAWIQNLYPNGSTKDDSLVVGGFRNLKTAS